MKCLGAMLFEERAHLPEHFHTIQKSALLKPHFSHVWVMEFNILFLGKVKISPASLASQP